jgi:hypothetical protein
MHINDHDRSAFYFLQQLVHSLSRLLSIFESLSSPLWRFRNEVLVVEGSHHPGTDQLNALEIVPGQHTRLLPSLHRALNRPSGLSCGYC